jgi:hypothetical protein
MGPVSLVIPNRCHAPARWLALACAGALGAGLLLCGCTTDDGPEYDIPAGERVLSAQLEADADGSPMILAEVGMYYGTRDKLQQWDPKYKLSNMQSILFTKRNGKWSSHPFRNLQEPYGPQALFARNGAGGIQPLIWDRLKLTLFARAGEDWVPRAITRLDEKAGHFSLGYGAPGAYHLALVGDSAWEATVLVPDRDNLIRIGRNDGTTFTLDSGFWFQPLGYRTGRDYNMVVGQRSALYRSDYSPTGGEPYPTPALVAYRWSLDPEHPDPRIQIVDGRPYPAGAFFGSADGEERFYENYGDSVVVFAVREGELVYLQTQVLGENELGENDGAPAKTGPSPYYSLYPDHQGCMQGFTQVYPDRGYGPDYQSGPTVLYRSSCASGVDTLSLPAELEKVPGYPSFFGPRFTADGRPMLLLTLVKTSTRFFNEISTEDEPKNPSWIYLATKSASGQWEWEQVAQY